MPHIASGSGPLISERKERETDRKGREEIKGREVLRQMDSRREEGTVWTGGKKSSRGFADVLQVDKNGDGKGQVTEK